MQCCLKPLRQLRIRFWPVQCCSKSIKTTLHRIFFWCNVVTNVVWSLPKFEDLKFFCMNNVTRYFIDRWDKTSGLLVFTKSHLPTRRLPKIKIPMDKQIIIFELNLPKEQWLLVSVYKPPAQDATYFPDWISQIIDFHSIIYGEQVHKIFSCYLSLNVPHGQDCIKTQA